MLLLFAIYMSNIFKKRHIVLAVLSNNLLGHLNEYIQRKRIHNPQRPQKLRRKYI